MKLQHLLQRLALLLCEDLEGSKLTSVQIFLLVSTLAFIVKETKQNKNYFLLFREQHI